MKARMLLALFCPAILAGAVIAQQPTSKIGQRIANLSFTDLDGKSFVLHDCKDKKAIVVAFMTFDCPVAVSYLAELSELARANKDLSVIGVCVSAEEREALAKQARDFQVAFPIVHDPKFAVADAFAAVITPEVFLLDGQFTVRYRGRIDDAYAARLKKNKDVTRHDLRQALDELLAGKAVSTPVTTPIGCAIIRPAAQPIDAKAKTRLTYYKDVLPILQNRCQTCHRPGEMGPFSLMTYEQAVHWSADIKEYTQSRQMPPWKPSAGLPMHGERKLTERELAVLAEWVDGGTPRGNAGDAPPPAKFADGWMLGQPDLILSPKEEFTLGPTGPDVYRCFVFPTELPEDKFVSAYEVRPGARQAVHHTVHVLDLHGRARRLEKRTQDRPRTGNERDFGPGYSSLMGPGFFPPNGDVGGWAPGLTPHFLPPGVGYYLPKGADFVAHVHYHRTGKVEKDKVQIGLYFSKKAVNKPLQMVPIGGFFLSIPPGEENYPVKGSLWAAQDCTLHTVMPHMHLLGKKIKITMTPPGGPPVTLIGMDQWDYNWQEIYVFKDPVKVKAETRFDVEGVFDNGAKNPNNPFSPPRRVFAGESTTNEMCFGFIGATIDGPGNIGFRLWPGGIVLRRLGAVPKSGP